MVEMLNDAAIGKMNFDDLIDLEEDLNQTINKMNFEIEGLNEEKERLEKYKKIGRDGEEKDVFERKVSLINRQLYRLNMSAANTMVYQQKISAERQSKAPKDFSALEKAKESNPRKEDD